jgi:hypothetical protein
MKKCEVNFSLRIQLLQKPGENVEIGHQIDFSLLRLTKGWTRMGGKSARAPVSPVVSVLIYDKSIISELF